ncbi:DUF4390 domain-containing protein [Aromatoleum toluolicum]|uniref:DUF4390 domain-containing protein n=1 Tax=Aromatoleum toluolicum TaxID=90060 RepID=A0ABX1NF48_9RHOO|nr:DUF4390 domain-containing protein [Aromatoleum toluolicum]NMF97808.1 DUF4390 domain-containing protein [Aromatoleum toluolicum]
MKRALAALALCLLMPLAALAEGRIDYAEIVSGDEGYVVNADIDLELNPRLVEAVNRGVSLYFSAQFVVERDRWYWLDEVVAERALNFRLTYNAIARSYRLSVGNFHQSFETLEAAVRTMQRIRNWQIVPVSELKVGTTYRAALRFQLDTNMLPKPFQVTAIGSSDWNLATDWLRWSFLAGATP